MKSQTWGDSRPRRGGDNGTPPRKPGSGSAEAQSEEASCGLKENRGSFRAGGNARLGVHFFLGKKIFSKKSAQNRLARHTLNEG